MNSDHMQVCASDEWRAMVQDQIMPWALGETELGDDVLEVGPGFGVTTDVLRVNIARITAVEINVDLATRLAERLADTNVEVVHGDATELPYESSRFSGAASFSMLHHVPSADLQDRLFAEVARVLRPGGVFVAADSVDSPDLRAFHHDDIYVPIDPARVGARLEANGFVEVEVRDNPFGWAAIARS